MVLKLLKGRRADTANLTAAQNRFEDIGCIHGAAAGGTGVGRGQEGGVRGREVPERSDAHGRAMADRLFVGAVHFGIVGVTLRVSKIKICAG